MENMTDFDMNKILVWLIAGGASAWAAYKDFSNQPAWKKGLMIFGPIVLLGLLLAMFG
jgi:hypothetical protein